MERRLVMKLSLLTLVVVAIVTFLVTTTLFFVLKMRNKNLYLSKFTALVVLPTFILFLFSVIGAWIDELLDLFFITWPLINSLVLLSFACFVGTIPIWIVVVILSIIKINKENIPTANDNPTTTSTEQEVHNENDQKKIHFKLIPTLIKRKWISLSKDRKIATLGLILFIITYISGGMVQIPNHESNNGERSIVAAILMVSGITIFIATRFKRMKNHDKDVSKD